MVKVSGSIWFISWMRQLNLDSFVVVSNKHVAACQEKQEIHHECSFHEINLIGNSEVFLICFHHRFQMQSFKIHTKKRNKNWEMETQSLSSEGTVRAGQARKSDWKKPIRSGEILPRWKQRLNKLYFCVSAARGTSAKCSVKVPFVQPPIHCLPVRAKLGKSWQTMRTE